MKRKKLKTTDVLAVAMLHPDKPKFVLVEALMAILTAIADGLPVSFFGEIGPYLEVNVAIDWITNELQYAKGKELTRLRESMHVLTQFRDSEVSEGDNIVIKPLTSSLPPRDGTPP